MYLCAILKSKFLQKTFFKCKNKLINNHKYSYIKACLQPELRHTIKQPLLCVLRRLSYISKRHKKCSGIIASSRWEKFAACWSAFARVVTRVECGSEWVSTCVCTPLKQLWWLQWGNASITTLHCCNVSCSRKLTF